MPAIQPTKKTTINTKNLLALLFIGVLVVIAIVSTLFSESKQTKSSVSSATPYDPDTTIIGDKPIQSSFDGSVLPVIQYLRVTLNDYDSSEFVEWSPVSKVKYEGQLYWGVRLKLRAKNAFGGYILKDTFYYIRHGKVEKTEGL